MCRKGRNCQLDLCDPAGFLRLSSQPDQLNALPDAQKGQLVFSLTPISLHPYLQLARIDRPIGWWLLLLPCWWSSALASGAAHLPVQWVHLGLFFIGAVAMRGAGSTYNDIVDRDIDAKVARTRTRPLPSGRVSVRFAAMFLVLQCLIGLCVLLSFNIFAICLGFSSLLVVLLYPFMKRITFWPQSVLGAAFAWGALMGWAAIFHELALPPVLLYLGAVCWTIGYDTIYAMQDIADDRMIGVKSTARLFGSKLRLAVGLFYAASVVLIYFSLLLAHSGVFAQIGLLLYALHLGWQVKTIDYDNEPRALKLFRSNRDAGLLLFAGLAFGVIV